MYRWDALPINLLQIFYPINNTAIGGGQQNDITFNAHSQTNFTFPFEITYKKDLDPSNKILVDIATKCGFIGGSKSQITVDYKISVSDSTAQSSRTLS